MPRAAEPICDDLGITSADELAAALAHGLTREGRKGWHRADDIMARMVAEELVDALEAAGFVIMQKPPELGGAQIGRGSKRKADCGKFSAR